MKELTKAQEEILLVLWEIREGAVSNILEKLDDPRPAYNTVATVVGVLEKKEYVGHKKFGKTKVYYPLISKKEYARFFLKEAVRGYFNGSIKTIVQFFLKDNELSIKELEELRIMVDKEIKDKK
jgi:BlaI family penicillinase repressor